MGFSAFYSFVSPSHVIRFQNTTRIILWKLFGQLFYQVISVDSPPTSSTLNTVHSSGLVSCPSSPGPCVGATSAFLPAPPTHAPCSPSCSRCYHHLPASDSLSFKLRLEVSYWASLLSFFLVWTSCPFNVFSLHAASLIITVLVTSWPGYLPGHPIGSSGAPGAKAPLSWLLDPQSLAQCLAQRGPWIVVEVEGWRNPVKGGLLNSSVP